ncbi:FAD/NAD(P)-binding domain-containing protein [Glonium stellatum]|uniref:FAD/NAD(P)-binding domain-containing protein n=1 Tax=Glonium stellatum TaxID=574774 RepID=A0A8E2F6B1_9PEZI|nr:FAD/NAD(P)-binding domain-containing protein [Glonium stellatum]
MVQTPPKHVAIIGAGLAGMCLAIELNKRSIQSTIYELRNPTHLTAGALMLSPNAIRVMEDIGLYERVKDKGYLFESIAFKDAEEKTTGVYYLGHEKLYGYQCLRLHRQVLLEELKAIIQEINVPIVYGKKFSSIVSETSEGVTFRFDDDTTATADMVIGADGIYSTVRQYIAPGTTANFSGLLALTCALQKKDVRFPRIEGEDGYHLPVAINGKPGQFVMAPQSSDGEELLAGTQIPYPEQDRAGWARLAADKDKLLSLMRKDYERWPDTVKSALDSVPKETMFDWPFYTMPKLHSWISTAGRVVILGDAAHAVPPAAGQGASQAFEDAYTLAILLEGISEKVGLQEALSFWNSKRQERVDGVVKLTLKINNMRLPQEEREKLAEEDISLSDERGQLAWLYGANIGKDFLDWIEEKTQN